MTALPSSPAPIDPHSASALPQIDEKKAKDEKEAKAEHISLLSFVSSSPKNTPPFAGPPRQVMSLDDECSEKVNKTVDKIKTILIRGDATSEQLVKMDKLIEDISKLSESQQNDLLKKVTKLENLFDPTSYTGKLYAEKDLAGVLDYLNTVHRFVIASTAATWDIISPTSSLSGKLGHHAFIVLPGLRLVERVMGAPTNVHQEFTQNEPRKLTGFEIEKLWQTHLKLILEYNKLGLSNQEGVGIAHYRPFTNDCFTYVNRVLQENNQSPAKLSRAPSNEAQLKGLCDKITMVYQAGRLFFHGPS